MLDVIEQLRLYGEAAEAEAEAEAAAAADDDRPVQLRPDRRRPRTPVVLAAAAAIALVAGIAAVAVRHDEGPSVSQAGPAPSPSSVPQGGPSADWGPLAMGGGAEDARHYDELLQMRDASDLVVVGTFTGFEPGRVQTIPGGPGEGLDDQLVWIDGRFHVDEILHADASLALDDVVDEGDGGQALTVEFLVGGSEQAPFVDDMAAGLDASLTARAGHTDQVVLFLRRNASPLNAADITDPCTEWSAEELEPLGMTPENCDRDEIRRQLGLDGGSGPEEAPDALRLVSSYGLITSTDAKPVDVPLNDTPSQMPHRLGEPQPLDHRDAWASLDELVDDIRSTDGGTAG